MTKTVLTRREKKLISKTETRRPFSCKQARGDGVEPSAAPGALGFSHPFVRRAQTLKHEHRQPGGTLGGSRAEYVSAKSSG